eukprot:TRINITY_DN5676_c0_g1_i4.p1 TRINITY_DN5676_c0_g1~~TRINITY_DN5676_c0_g1_i4.p1  ORF type:complete len:841 (-),score=164.24 TRINITY_DN5676_c0_g1_i4:190-2712(-)
MPADELRLPVRRKRMGITFGPGCDDSVDLAAMQSSPSVKSDLAAMQSSPSVKSEASFEGEVDYLRAEVARLRDEIKIQTEQKRQKEDRCDQLTETVQFLEGKLRSTGPFKEESLSPSRGVSPWRQMPPHWWPVASLWRLGWCVNALEDVQGATSAPSSPSSPKFSHPAPNFADSSEGNGGSVTVTVRLAQGRTQNVTLPAHVANCLELRRQLGRSMNTPLVCLKVTRHGVACANERPASNGEFFELQDTRMIFLPNMQVSPTTFKNEDFHFAESAEVTLRPESRMPTWVSFTKESLRGQVAKLRDTIADWPLFMHLSPSCYVSTGLHSYIVGIPPGAEFYAFAYPCSIDWKCLNSSLLTGGISDVDFMHNGGFVFFDNRGRMLKALAISTSESGRIRFSPKVTFNTCRVMKELQRQGRLHPVTIKSLCDAGVGSFAWILPGELTHGEEPRGSHFDSICPHGGFAYHYASGALDHLEEEEGLLDIFPLLGKDDEQAFLAQEAMDSPAVRGNRKAAEAHAAALSAALRGRITSVGFDGLSSRTPREGQNLMGSTTSRRRSSISRGKSLVESVDRALLGQALANKRTNWDVARKVVQRLRDPSYNSLHFLQDVKEAFPELELIRTTAPTDPMSDTSPVSNETSVTGSPATRAIQILEDEYQRALGAFMAFFWLMRLDLDGKECFCFGITSSGNPQVNPGYMSRASTVTSVPGSASQSPGSANSSPLMNRVSSVQMPPQQKRKHFYETAAWSQIEDVFVTAGLLRRLGHDQGGGIQIAGPAFKHDEELVLAMLVLLAISRVMRLGEWTESTRNAANVDKTDLRYVRTSISSFAASADTCDFASL